MRGIVLTALALALAALALAAPAAIADNGQPHTGYTRTTEKCATCHRAHTAAGPELLVTDSVYQLCTTCHGPTGTGANTDVVDGVYVNRVSPAVADGTYGRGLLGGGFVNTLMNTASTSTGPGSQPATSSHTVDGTTSTTVWGYGPKGSTTLYRGPSNVTLDCADCHNPHGRAGTSGQATYRLLRAQPIISGVTYTALADVADLATKTYTVASATNVYNRGGNVDYPLVGSTDYRNLLMTWCRTCHTRYYSTQNFSSTGDLFLTSLHVTDTARRTCVACHVAHGSSAVVVSYTTKNRRAHRAGSGTVTVPPDSALLRGNIGGTSTTGGAQNDWLCDSGTSDGRDCHGNP